MRRAIQQNIRKGCVLIVMSLVVQTGLAKEQILKSWQQVDGALVVVVSAGDPATPQVVTSIAAKGNSTVHVLAESEKEVAAINAAVAKAGLQGVISVEALALSPLPYRDHLVNDFVIMNEPKSEALGLTPSEIRRVVAPYGRLVRAKKGKVGTAEIMPLPESMDTWTHRYRQADGIPSSKDTALDLPLGFKWNAGLPMNFNNPERGSNRYSSTRAMVADDGRLFTFSTAVVENLGATWRSNFGTDQYLICRDAFNGRLLWKKRVGNTYYGGLYIENMAPLVSTGRRLYYGGEDGQMIVADSRTGKTIRSLPTVYIPGVIASADGIVVAATWKNGESMGAIKNYDRRRMDWAIETGTVEAFSDETGERLWKKDLLGTSLLIADGRVFIVNRESRDPVEENSGRKKVKFDVPPERPSSWLVAMELQTGEEIWRSTDEELKVPKERLSLESAGKGGVTVAHGSTSRVKVVSAATGNLAGPELLEQTRDLFFRYRNSICMPAFRANGMNLGNRGGRISKGKESVTFGGARGACLTGTVPAYGAAFIAQNWCKCSPGQIPGLLAVSSIGQMLTPEEMERPTRPKQIGTYTPQGDELPGAGWNTFRGNTARSSSVDCEIAKEVSIAWTSASKPLKVLGSLHHDWRAYLNSRVTAAALTDDLAIVGDLDRNELVALNRASGKRVWRTPLASRVDSAPTISGGLCLMGDHSGYVYAVKIKTGELVYKLRIAPEEKRMMSYGKVESVWPVIGGVLVNDGKAYASAGRTQGSDGGLLVRCFDVPTGKLRWSKAIPQEGEGVTGRPRRNDCLLFEEGFVRLMEHRLNPETGAFEIAGLATAIQDATDKVEKETGEKPDRRALQLIEKDLQAKHPSAMIGLEGLYSWHWTRLGNRKFGSIGYGGKAGLAAAWNDRYVAAVDQAGNLRMLPIYPPEDGQPTLPGFARRLPATHQVTSMVLCENMLVIGGLIDEEDQAKGFVMGIDFTAPQKPQLAESWSETFDVPLAFNGLAIDRGEIFVSLHDGRMAKLQ